MSVWNFGALWLRLAPDAATAAAAEVALHVGVITLAPFYYHFALEFLEITPRHRASLAAAYGLAAVFLAVDLAPTPLFMRGVTLTYWGWAPATGPLYLPFVVFVNATIITGLVRLARAYRGMASSFRRNRTLLVVFGTAVSLGGGAVDFARFLIAHLLPAADHLYPIGIPANAVFALALGTSIVRYRLFDVSAAVKRWAVSLAAAGLVLGALLFTVPERQLLWILVPVGVLLALLVTPAAQPLADRARGLMFSRRRGCYDTLLDLSRRMGALLDVHALVETLVRGLVRGVPLTHCALLLHDADGKAFTPACVESATGHPPAVPTLPDDGALAQRLAESAGVLVVEEASVNPALARRFADGLGALEAALVVPLRLEARLVGLLLVGEKLSGEIFDRDELAMLGVLATQAAVALQNARLYEDARRAYRELARAQDRLAQAQKMEAVGRLAGGIAHDFNNLLTVIGGRVSLLLDTLGPGDPRRKDAALIERTAERAQALTRQLLAFSRKQVLRPRPLDLNNLVTGVAPMLRRLIGEHIELQTLPRATRPRVTADPGQLEQVVVNLAVNARDAMPRGGRLVLETRDGDTDVTLAVTDTGTGMDETVRAHLFEPFFTTKGVGHGTGLGLATVHGIVEQSGGRIAVDTRPGEGTTFTVSLPRTAEPAESEPPAGPDAPAPGGSETVLLVEDEEEVRGLAREILETAGYVVLEARDGAEAITASAAHAGPIDLMLTDVVMPRMGGPDAARHLAPTRPGMAILYMSGYAEGVELPADALEKPFTPEALTRAVRDRLDGGRAKRE